MPGPLIGRLVEWWKLDEASNADAVGAHAGKTLSQTANTVETDSGGKYNSARSFVFDSVCQLVRSDLAFRAGAGKSFAFTCWVKPSQDPGTSYFYVASVSDTPWKLTLGGPPARFALTWTPAGGGSADSLVSSVAVSTGSWYFVAVSFDSATKQAVLRVNATTSSVTLGDDISGLGQSFSLSVPSGGAASQSWQGLIDEASFFSSALTDAELTYLYNSGSGRQYGDLSSGTLSATDADSAAVSLSESTSTFRPLSSVETAAVTLAPESGARVDLTPSSADSLGAPISESAFNGNLVAVSDSFAVVQGDAGVGVMGVQGPDSLGASTTEVSFAGEFLNANDGHSLSVSESAARSKAIVFDELLVAALVEASPVRNLIAGVDSPGSQVADVESAVRKAGLADSLASSFSAEVGSPPGVSLAAAESVRVRLAEPASASVASPAADGLSVVALDATAPEFRQVALDAVSAAVADSFSTGAQAAGADSLGARLAEAQSARVRPVGSDAVAASLSEAQAARRLLYEPEVASASLGDAGAAQVVLASRRGSDVALVGLGEAGSALVPTASSDGLGVAASDAPAGRRVSLAALDSLASQLVEALVAETSRVAPDSLSVSANDQPAGPLVSRPASDVARVSLSVEVPVRVVTSGLVDDSFAADLTLGVVAAGVVAQRFVAVDAATSGPRRRL